jgi:hypothetical protein
MVYQMVFHEFICRHVNVNLSRRDKRDQSEASIVRVHLSTRHETAGTNQERALQQFICRQKFIKTNSTLAATEKII